MADQAPPEDVQNSNSGSSAGDDSTSALETPTFPDRLRVHALAKILGVTSKQVLAKLGELGIEARSAQSSLGRDVAETVQSAFAAPDSAALDVGAADPTVPLTDAAPVVPVPPVDVGTPVREEPAAPETDPSTRAEPENSLFSTPLAQPAPATRTGDASDSVAPARTAFATPLFLQPEAAVEAAPKRRRSRKAAGPAAEATSNDGPEVSATEQAADSGSPAAPPTVVESKSRESERADNNDDDDEVDTSGDSESDSSTSDDGDDDQSQPRRRRRGRRGRGRGRGDQASDGNSDDNDNDDNEDSDDSSDNRSSDDSGSEDTSSNTTPADGADVEDDSASTDESADGDSGDKPTGERRSRRRSRSRSGSRSSDAADDEDSTPSSDSDDAEDEAAESSSAQSSSEDSDDDDDQDGADGSSRRRRRRRRRRSSGDAASDSASSEDDPLNTVVHEREPRNKARNKDEVQGISGSTRLEAKRQRRRDGRDAGRRRPPILTESEFLARRESVDRVMVVREKSFPEQGETTQVAVLEDGVLVEHFVTSSASASMVGNVYLGRVQNVLPSMEAAFVDIGRGRNGVLYAGEVNWDAAGLGGNSRKIEQALKPGDQVLVQVSKDPVGHKGARLTTQLSLAGRYLVYVPGGSSTGISRKLPDTERKRLKEILRDIVPSEAGVIIRTAAEGVSEDELARDVERLQAQWASIEEASANAETGKGSQPQTLYEEPDLLVKVIRDLFNEDFVKLVIEGEKAWSTTSNYIETVAADMMPKLERHVAESGKPDVFEAHRIDEQLAKALDRKVWLPSGGTLVIDRTEAMTVVDVNTGKFTGSGGNLEETVTRNNLEAAEEVVRQMRLRDIGGMIVVDFIDMVLESNRDLVLRRLTEALGRDRTRHQVSEVTSLGLVQMTRKKMGTGLVEAFSTTCEHCQGRGIIVHPFPVDAKPDDGQRGGSARSESGSQRKRRGRDKADNAGSNSTPHSGSPAPTPEHDEHGVDPSVKRAHPVALAMAAHHDEVVADVTPADVFDHNADGSAGPDAQVIDAVDVAAVQGESIQDAAADSVVVESVSTGDTGNSEPTASGRRSGRSGRRKASRPTAAARHEVSTGSDAAGAPGADVSTPTEDDTASSNGAAPAVMPEAAAAHAVEESTAGSPTVDSPTADPAEGQPVVKARRGRRVARKAAAPTAETPDAGAVFVIPATSDEVTNKGEPEVAPMTTPAFTQVDASEVAVEQPVSKPRRRRAAARPAGPPVDA
ncbi:translation initiation factor IF-2 N-terminal domain-containing protein [Rhodococcus sp. G-MC3]|uniref:translation initiation factor IF-2 N-terminal domain-containing protein n=1 Tax=Rhodococcus sp. G-MC3 TaxID=3046209 RepID=UPI0024BBDCAC|nr:translation initiation factor IF-2 N-terminal domain-containing protein [Rhodococcus sp. G-MC3]MDJ0394504.1 translation initiation factor IF-2 N-terminal domain-containing protein [Rhodococcus sp. G-MC3]